MAVAMRPPARDVAVQHEFIESRAGIAGHQIGRV
jgi:hypothetical protein